MESGSSATNPASEREIASVMEVMPYGLYILGSTGTLGVNGMMADWVTQVSFKPRLLATVIENDAQTLANISASKVFVLNFLPESRPGMELARHFAHPFLNAKVGGPDATGSRPKMIPGTYRLGHGGCPVLNLAMAWLGCDVVDLVPTGDHTLVVGKVVNGRLLTDEEPLTSSYTGWTYSG